MNIKENRLLLLFALFLFSTGCSTVDPPPYFFSPEPLPSLKEQDRMKREYRDKAEAYISQHPELTKRQKGLILSGVVGEGLTKEQTKLIYGDEPDKIETTNLKYNADEMWFYRGVNWNDYFYFKDDILIKIDHSR